MSSFEEKAAPPASGARAGQAGRQRLHSDSASNKSPCASSSASLAADATTQTSCGQAGAFNRAQSASSLEAIKTSVAAHTEHQAAGLAAAAAAAATTTTTTVAALVSAPNKRADGNDMGLSEADREALERIACVEEFEEYARGRMDRMTYDYYAGGADEELTLRWNRQMIGQKYNLRPRVMCDVSRVDTTKYIYGDRLAMPVGVSPTAMHKMAHPAGELATVRACKRANALMILSLFSTSSLEEVARQEPACTKWQNLYILKRREITASVVARAVRNAYRAIVVTCDAPVLGNRRHDKHNQLSLAAYPLCNLNESTPMNVREHSSSIFDPSVTWHDLAELKKQAGDTVRVIAKGIMTPEDAEQALQAGVDGVYVSNHGGRQLDGCQSTIEALPAIVRAVNKRCPVFVDGGFRTGADILKALALGADMVFVGRAPLMGLAAFGEEGVYRVLSMLQDELRRAMMLCGCNKLSDINRNMILERHE